MVELLLTLGKANADLANKVFVSVVFRISCRLFSFNLLLLLLFLFVVSQRDGCTPLYVASEKGHDKVVELLFTQGKANAYLADEV